MTFVALFLGGFLGSFVAQLSGPAIARLRVRRAIKAIAKQAGAEPIVPVESPPIAVQPTLNGSPFNARKVKVFRQGVLTADVEAILDLYRRSGAEIEIEDCDCGACTEIRRREDEKKARLS
jgi:hypothetical protein